MEQKIAVFQVERASVEQLRVEQVSAGNAAEVLGGTCSTLTPVLVKEEAYLLAYDSTSGKATVVRQTSAAPWLTRVGSIALGTALDAIEPFILANQPYLMCYQAKAGIDPNGAATRDGTFTFCQVLESLKLGVGYRFRRTHELGITKGFTTVKAFTSAGQVTFLGYNAATGYVAIFTLSITATSPPFTPPGTPPLVAVPKWSHPWAPGWTRFAFFQLGGENFFFKTNTVTPNVNIDHVHDDLTMGTVEVSSQMQQRYPGVMNLQIVQPLVLGNGDPHFIGYDSDGTTTINRFHVDCQGWTKVASFAAPAGATQIVSSVIGDRALIVVC
jgi:hypothetical protein